MSKTDKTKPYRVKLQEHHIEHHDHRNGICDIAGLSVAQAEAASKQAWVYAKRQWHDPAVKRDWAMRCDYWPKYSARAFLCGCWWCGGSEPLGRRHARRIAKQQLREENHD